MKLKNLSRYYGDFAAISDISFSIQQHEIIGFLGLNGAGKSTTLKSLAGLLSPSTGQVFINGSNWIENPDTFRANIGFLPEEPPLYKEMTVRRFLRYLGRLRKFPSANIEERIDKVLNLCQLNDRADQIIAELSLGYRKRVGIAQAIIHKPSLVILDEPTGGLDPQQMVELRKVIQGLSGEATVLLSSHNLTEVAETCDRMLILHAGTIIAEGDQETLSQRMDSTQQTIDVIVSNRTNLNDLLEQLSQIKSFTTTESDQRITVHCTINSSTPELIAEWSGKALKFIKSHQPNQELEQIFLSLTGGTL